MHLHQILKRLYVIRESNGKLYLYRKCFNGDFMVYKNPYGKDDQVIAIFRPKPKHTIETVNPPY